MVPKSMDEVENMVEQAVLDKIKNVTQGVIEALGIKTQSVSADWQDEQERIYVSVDAGELNGFLIGRDGRMLDALKLIIEAGISRSENKPIDMYLDVGGYWNRMENEALDAAKRICEEVRRSGRSRRLEPMHSLLRRFVHRALQAELGVKTESEGEGTWRSIVIIPKH